MSYVPESRRRILAGAETGVTLLAALCWTVLAFAMYAEGYDLDASAPVQMSGQEEIESLALWFALSVPVTWLVRLVPWEPARTAADVVIALRLAAVLLLSLAMFAALLTGERLPLLGWSI
ncbi:hypothetical protein [Streptomyces sp. NPDC053367]|uniref:hypothetical protein n=1 Tax=Streptomyces sp. NPDC053367 TaxID=3365700 RepID=UPI0037D86B77